ncbi:MAG TPA: glycosyltransferase [Herpetosiphonaceae bacterium]|nr:glycosyltransferase [Herpetosiphonaceae bacterium]
MGAALRITLIALGTRGEIQPYVALGAGLRAAGHAVRLATHGDYAGLALGHGLGFYAIRGELRALLARAEAPAIMDPQRHPLGFLSHGLAALRPLLRGWIEDLRAASRDSDLIVSSEMGLYLGLHVAELAGIPLLRAFIAPKTATAAGASIHAPDWPGGLPGRRAYNRATHAAVGAVVRLAARALFGGLRRELALEPLPWRGDWLIGDGPVIYGFSPLLAPPAPDWPANHHVTGAWVLGGQFGWTPPPELARFLEAGEPPLAIGFSSVREADPAGLARLAADALGAAGLRGVLLGGWSGLPAPERGSRLIGLPQAPHEWLYPRMAAIVHHGGAGATAAALRAGKPALAVPFNGDQPFWGRRIAAVGAGPPPLPRRRLSAERLAGRMAWLASDHGVRAAAAGLGERMRREDGVAAAVALIEHYAADRTGITGILAGQTL